MVATSTHLEARASAVPAGEKRSRTSRIDGDLALVAPDSPCSHDLINGLIETNARLARSIAARYRNRGIDLDDLEQVALLGLTKAARRFDPDAGHDFLSYAVPTIRGEIRRHFRDAGWTVRPPRRVQELQARIARAQEELERQLCRSPRPSELAAHLDEDIDSIVEALTADGCFTPTSLDGPLEEGSAFTLGDMLAADDRATESAEARAVLAPLVGRLCERDQRILQMRFVEDRTQREIGEVLGLTQAQISRILTGIVDTLRAELSEPSSAA